MDERFVGRPTELAFLRERLEEVRRGTARVVLLEGAAGVGKTALLRELLAGTDHLRVLWASGEELEAGLAYGVIGQLVADAATPPPDSLTSLGLRGGDADPLEVGMTVIDLLGGLQATGPVVLAVDDLHWVDLPSLHALVLALRRLRAERVLALLSVRDDRKELLPAGLHRLVAGASGARLRLGGLGVDELRALGGALGAGRLSRRTAVRLREHTGGNPCQARALLEELPADVFRQNPQPLPAPRSFRMLFSARRAACPPNAERLVEAAAVLGARCPLALAASLAMLDDPLDALEQAIAAGLLEERPTATTRMVAFPHPLIRAAVYHDLGPARRAALHACAARLTDGEPAALRHRIAAAGGPDPALTSELAGLARRQAAAGAWTAAADSLLAAARLAAAPAERERLVLEAVDHLLLGGSAAEAAAFTEEVATFADAARRDYVLARLAAVGGRHADAERLLLSALADGDLGDDRELATGILGQLALHSLVRARGRQAVTWARRALTRRLDGPVRGNLLDLLTIGLVITGRVPEAITRTAGLQSPAAARAPGGLDGWVGRGLARMWSDDLVGAHRDLTAALAGYRRHRMPLPWGVIAQAVLAEVDYRLGAWDDASQHAEQAVSLAGDSDELWLMPFAHAVAAFPLACRGAREPAAAHAAAAARHLRVIDAESGIAWVAAAQAMVALADGDDQQVVAALEPLRRLPPGTAVDEPAWHPWRALCAEALAGLGCWAEADAVLAPLEAIAAARGLRSALAAASRARGTLEAARNHASRAELAFRAGLEHAAVVAAPFDHALLKLAYGQFLRRAGRHRDAVRQLEAARQRLARLGARPYLERCRRELARCDDHPASRNGTGPRGALTPQELAVARLVAAGCTNRQAAAELVVSVKTIEYHLGNAYAKFGVTSRTQLALAMGQD